MALKIGDIGLRAASAVVLAPAAVLATWAGGGWFCALVVAASICLIVAELPPVSPTSSMAFSSSSNWRSMNVARVCGEVFMRVKADSGTMTRSQSWEAD